MLLYIFSTTQSVRRNKIALLPTIVVLWFNKGINYKGIKYNNKGKYLLLNIIINIIIKALIIIRITEL